MKVEIISIVLCGCCFAQQPIPKQSATTQASSGTCSPNIFGVSGSVSIQCGNDPKAFEIVVQGYMNAIRERDKAEADRRLAQEQLSTQTRLSTQERLQLKETVAKRDAELSTKAEQVEEWATKYRQLAEQLRISEEAKAATLHRLRRTYNEDRPTDATLSSNGRFVVTCRYPGQCQVDQYENMVTVGRYDIKSGFAPKAFVADDGRSILLIDNSSMELRVYSDSSNAPKIVMSLREPKATMSATADFHYAAVGYPDGSAELLNLETGMREVLRGDGASVSALEFSADGELLASGEEDGSVVLWNVLTRTRMSAFRMPKSVSRIRFSKEGHLVAIGASSGEGAVRGTVQLWDTKQSVPLIEFSVFGEIKEISFSEDERSLMVAHGGGLLQAPITYQSLSGALCGLTIPLRNTSPRQDPQRSDVCPTLVTK